MQVYDIIRNGKCIETQKHLRSIYLSLARQWWLRICHLRSTNKNKQNLFVKLEAKDGIKMRKRV